MLVLGIFAVLLAGVYVGGVLWFQNHFFFNTSVNGLNASGKTVDEMDEMAQNAASQYHIEIRERGGIREYIHGSQIDYHPVQEKRLHCKGQPGSPFLAFWLFEKTALYFCIQHGV